MRWTARPLRPALPAQGIEAESPEEARSAFEDLQRKARFARLTGGQMRPNHAFDEPDGG